MKQPLRALIIEDSPEDARLVLRELTRGGFEVSHAIVGTAAEMRAALERQRWDVILCDYAMPRFSGQAALPIARELGQDAPFIFVSGTIGEETAVEAMKSGAQDYVMKGHLARLVPAIQRELREVETRRKARRAEESLVLFRSLLDHANEIIEVVDPATGCFLDVNEKGCVAHGCTRQEYLALRVWEVDSQNSEAAMREVWEELRTSGARVMESRRRRKDGSTFPVEVNLTRVPLNRDYIVAVVRDITERKRVEERIRQLTRTRAVLSGINQLIVHEREPQTILEGACRIAVESGGFPLAWVGLLEASGGKTLKVVAHAGADARMAAELGRVGEAAQPESSPISRVLKAGGHAVCNDDPRDPGLASWCAKALHSNFRAMASFALTAAGQHVGVLSLYATEPDFFNPEELILLNELAADIGFALEICERERERRSAMERIRQLAAFPELNPNSVLEFTAAGELNYYNPAALALSASLGLAKVGALLPADARETARHCLATNTPRPPFETTHGSRTLSWAFHPIREINAVHCYVVEITGRLQLEEQLRQSQKMEAIGQLAGGIAHDFNNILSGILMQAELGGSEAGLSHELSEGFRQIRADAERAANLTRQLLLFSRKQVMQPRDLDLNDEVTGLAKMLQRIIGEDVRLQLNLHPTPLLTHADAGMLDQVLMNLAVNARDAMPKGGLLTIATGDKTVGAADAPQPDAAPGRYVCLSVSDTGCGIPADVLPRIFEPFFTTKAPDKGTGLGLATVFGIIKQHRGWLTVKSEAGRGSVFQVFLPAGVAPALPGAAAAAAKPRGGTETILLVEDEAGVRRITRMILVRNGYKVLEAANGSEAVKIWEEQKGAIDLLVTDLVMPAGISGQQLAERLQADKADLRVVYISGYSAEIAGREIELRRGENFLPKPFQSNQILEAIRRCLDN